MLPNETRASSPDADIVDRFRDRADSDSKQSRKAAIKAAQRRQSISEESRASPNVGDTGQHQSTAGSRGSVLADLFRFRRKSVNPVVVFASQEVPAKPSTEPESSSVSGQQRQRSRSTVDRPHIYLTDPAVNRPQVSPTTVESVRAKQLRQKQDLAPQWVKMANQDLSASSADHYETNGGQSVMTVPQSTSGARSPVAPRKAEAKRSVFDTNWNQISTHKDTGRRRSMIPTGTLSPPNAADPEFVSSSDVISRSGSKGIADFFRIRKKSSSNSPSLPISSPDPKDSRSKSPMRGSKKTPLPILRRQRSKSTVDPPVLPFDLRDQTKATSEPIGVRVFHGKRDLHLSGPSFQTESQATPMSELLSRQTSPSAAKQAFGIIDFLELYNSQNSSDSKKDGLKSQNRGLSDAQQPVVDEFTSAEREDDANIPPSGFSPTRTISGQALQTDLPESIPEYLEVHQVSSMSSLQSARRRRNSPAVVYQTPDSESSRDLADRYQRSRRYSEPPKPNLWQMNVLNSIHMKLVSGDDTGSQQDQDNIKTKTSPPAIAQTLGIRIPMTSRHKLLLWRDKETGTQLLKLPVKSQGNQDELYNIDSNDKLTFVKLLKLHKCHELMPRSAMMVLLDSELKVISAFFALMFNGIKAAPIWDASKRDFVAMLTVTDFINVLQMHYKSPEEIGNLEEHKISNWIDLLHGHRKSMISVDPEDSLFDAVVQLSTNKFHRILVADSVSGDALYVLNYKRIIQFIYLLTYEVELPSYMEQSIWDLQIGTYGDKLSTVTPKSRLIDALGLLVKRRISALPVVDDNGRPINIYAKVDAINLAASECYKNLDTTVEETLKIQRERFEGVFLCKRTDTLGQVIKWLIQENIHRMLVVDDDLILLGIVSLSDIVHFLVIRQNEESGGDFQPGDINTELDIRL